MLKVLNLVPFYTVPGFPMPQCPCNRHWKKNCLKNFTKPSRTRQI
jgi:hypothetical protein